MPTLTVPFIHWIPASKALNSALDCIDTTSVDKREWPGSKEIIRQIREGSKMSSRREKVDYLSVGIYPMPRGYSN